MHTCTYTGSNVDTIEMLTPDRLDYIRRLEMAIREFGGYGVWCKKENSVAGATCSPPSSVATYLYPSIVDSHLGADCQLRYDGRGTKLVRPLHESLEALVHTSDVYDWFFSLSHTPLKSTLVRSEFTFALDRIPTDKERSDFRDWLGGMINAIQRERDREGSGSGLDVGVTVLVGGSVPTDILIHRELRRDMTLAAVSMLLVLIYTWFHTTSIVLAGFAMSMIALSFPVSIFFYDLFFGHANLGVLNILSIYIVLGVGVDDCYVFLDAFQQSRGKGTPKQTFGSALTRSARAMFVTSFTTSLAFLANLVSSIPVIYSFAVFMAALVIINYVFTVTIFVAMVSVWHYYIEEYENEVFNVVLRRCPWIRKIKSACSPAVPELKQPEPPATPALNDSEPPQSHTATLNDFATLDDAFVVVDESAPGPVAPQLSQSTKRLGMTANRQTTEILERLKQDQITLETLRPTEQWFLLKFGPFLKNHRRHLLTFVTLLVVVCFILALQLQPSREIPHLFPKGHSIQLFWEFNTNNFTAGSCDECAALYKTDYLCNGVVCGGANQCIHGLCYGLAGAQLTKLTAAEIPCTFDNDLIQSSCVHAMTLASNYNVFSTPQPTNPVPLAGNVLQASFGVWDPAFSVSSTGCRDDYRECWAWADRGECEDNPPFMGEYCKFSCGLCHGETEDFFECFDGADNNNNGRIDCADPDCASYPLCRLRNAPNMSQSQLVVVSHALNDTSCRGTFIDPMLSSCTNLAQQGQINNLIAQVCNLAPTNQLPSLGVVSNNLCTSANRSTYFTPPPPGPASACVYAGFEDTTVVETPDYIGIEICLCDSKEKSFYLSTGLLLTLFALFMNYSASLARRRRHNELEYKLCALCALAFYILGSVPIVFWLSCMRTESASKEQGFMKFMFAVAVLLLCALGLARYRWRDAIAQEPELARKYMCFLLTSVLTVLCCAFYGMMRTRDDDIFVGTHSQLISSCGLFAVNETVNESDAQSERLQAARDADCKPSEATCSEQESMVYGALGACLLISCVCVILGLRIDTVRPPPSLNSATVGVFGMHGMIAVYCWARCVSNNESQEQLFFWLYLGWSICSLCLQYAHAKTKHAMDIGACVLMSLAVGFVAFSSVGVHITTSNGDTWLGQCSTMTVIQEAGVEELLTGATKRDYSESDAGRARADIEAGKCIVDDACSSLEKSTYGLLGVLGLLALCQVCCLSSLRCVQVKSVNMATLSLWMVHVLLFLVFWTSCSVSDSSVEKPFWLALLIWSVIMTAALTFYGVAKNIMDTVMKAQIGIAVGFVALAAIMVHITFTNGDMVLRGCTEFERCHWWSNGMSPVVPCSSYWSRLRQDTCSSTRCGGHGLCVGFKYTGGCVCSPSFTGRFCDSPVAINTNKAEVAIVFGLQGTFEDTSNPNSAVDDDATLHTPEYFATLNFASPSVQTSIVNLCEDLSALANVVQTQSIMCFMSDFRDWRHARGETFPVPSYLFLSKFKEWLSTDGGQYFMHVGFDRSVLTGSSYRLSFAKITFYSHLSKFESGFVALPTFNAIEQLLIDFNAKSGLASLGTPAYQTSDLWIKMFTEVSAVNGIMYALVIVALCSFVTIFAFTGHVRMACIVVSCVFSMLFTILGYFKMVGWSLGVVEAVSALVLIGSSVDYSLHIAEAFVECSQQNRSSLNPLGRTALVTQALTKIGVSVFHAAVTTLLSVVCLLFCRVTLFVKFGQIIMVSVFVSIVFALVPLPAMLGLYGPKRFRRSFKRQLMMLAALLSIGIVLLVMLYSMDRAGHIDLRGPAGEPLFGRTERVDNGLLEA